MFCIYEHFKVLFTQKKYSHVSKSSKEYSRDFKIKGWTDQWLFVILWLVWSVDWTRLLLDTLSPWKRDYSFIFKEKHPNIWSSHRCQYHSSVLANTCADRPLGRRHACLAPTRAATPERLSAVSPSGSYPAISLSPLNHLDEEWKEKSSFRTLNALTGLAVR